MVLTVAIILQTLLASLRQVSSHPDCIGTCYSGRLLPETQDIFTGKHLKGFSYKNITTDDPRKCYSSCVQDCRCKACQMKTPRCELLDEDKTSKTDNFVAKSGYVYYDLKQTMYQGKSHMLPPGVCYNGCCRSQPCKNGGTCTEHCQSPKKKFTCTCRTRNFGSVCENTYYPSCGAVLRAGGVQAKRGVYWIKRTDNQNTFPVYCHFTPKRAWTLIESFSLEKNPFKFKPFTFDYEMNSLKVPSWDSYRLGLSRMKYIRSKSSLFKATCNFIKRETQQRPDYLLGSLSDVDIINVGDIEGCKRYKLIDIRGYQCSNCLALTAHGRYGNWHYHLDVTWGLCDFKPPYVKKNVDSFGHYTTVDNVSKCTQTPQSTTEWWLGEEITA